MCGIVQAVEQAIGDVAQNVGHGRHARCRPVAMATDSAAVEDMEAVHAISVTRPNTGLAKDMVL